MLLLQDFSVKLFSNYKKTTGMTLQMNTFSGATNTLRRPWYECFLFYLLSFNCQCKETSIFMFSTFEISTTGRTPGAPKEES